MYARTSFPSLLLPRASASGGGAPGSDGSATGEGQHPSSSSSRWRQVYPDGPAAARNGRKTSSEWMQVYPRPGGEADGASSEELRRRPQGAAAGPAASSAPKAAHASSGGEGGGAWGPWKLSAAGGGGGDGAADERARGEGSLWAWAERGGVPIGRLLSLLSLRVADCGKTRVRFDDAACCLVLLVLVRRGGWETRGRWVRAAKHKFRLQHGVSIVCMSRML